MWRQSRKSSRETARHNGHVCLRNEHPESVLERHHGACATAAALGVDDEDRSFFLYFAAQIGQGVGAASFSPHWQGVEHDRRERAGHIALKKNIARGGGHGAFAMAGKNG